MSIVLRGVERHFAGVPVLRDVNVQAKDGEMLALLGPSGSGKTTLLRVIAGLDYPDAGQIFFHGDDVSAVPVRHRKVGFVFQSYALFEHMRVADNVAFGLEVMPRAERPSKKAIREEVDQLLERVELRGMGQRYPHQLSGGQRQRVALARVLASKPRVLLLDEPFGALDNMVRVELRTWVRQLQRDLNMTAVLVTHDQDEAFELADRVVVMRAGRVEQIGTADELMRAPATQFVESFVRNPLRVATPRMEWA